MLQYTAQRIFGLSLILVFLAQAACGRPDAPSLQAVPPTPDIVIPTSEPDLAFDTPAASDTAHMPLVVKPPEIIVPPTAATWTQLSGNPQRTAYIETTLGPRTSWKFKWVWNGPAPGTDGNPPAGHLSLPKGIQPVVGAGKLYVGHSDGKLRAINATTGAEDWSATLGGEILNTAAFDPATASVFVGSTDGRLYKVRASDGLVLGNYDAGGRIEMAPLLVGNTVYIGTMTGVLHAVNTANLSRRWTYSAGAALLASPAYSANFDGLIILAAEDRGIHAVQAANGQRRWRVTVNADGDPLRQNRRFPDTHPVVSEANGLVIIRSYFAWQKTWQPAGGAPDTVDGIRQFLQANAGHESFHVLSLDNGSKPFRVPVLAGGIGNNDDYYSTPPQAVIKRLPDGKEVAYLFWRNRQACTLSPSACDGREDTALGEMDLTTGNIRFVQSYKNEGNMRFPTDEQGTLSLAGNDLFHSHWMTMGAIRITDRSAALRGSISNPIKTSELYPVINTISNTSCPQRNVANRFCPVGTTPPGEGYQNDAGFYIYYSATRIYDQFYHPPVRSVVIDNSTIYWRSVDGAIIAIETK